MRELPVRHGLQLLLGDAEDALVARHPQVALPIGEDLEDDVIEEALGAVRRVKRPFFQRKRPWVVPTQSVSTVLEDARTSPLMGLPGADKVVTRPSEYDASPPPWVPIQNPPRPAASARG